MSASEISHYVITEESSTGFLVLIYCLIKLNVTRPINLPPSSYGCWLDTFRG